MSDTEPIIILVGLQADGATYALHPLSKRRLKAAFPTASPLPSVFVGYEQREEFLKRHEPIWGQIIQLLTGVSVEQLHGLGAVIIQSPATNQRFEVAA